MVAIKLQAAFKRLTYKDLIKKSFLCFLLFSVTYMFTACSKDESDPNSEVSGLVNGGEKNGFHISEIGRTYATISATIDDMKRIYFEGFGVKDISKIDLASYGVTEENLNIVLENAFYIEVSDKEDFSHVLTNKQGIIEGNSFKYEFGSMNPSTKYLYRVYQLGPDAEYHYNKTYSFTTLPIDESKISVETGHGYVSRYFNNIGKCHVTVENSKIQVEGLDEKDLKNIWYSVIISNSRARLEPPLKETWYDDQPAYFMPGNGEITKNDGKTTIQYSLTSSSNGGYDGIRVHNTYYYCAFLAIGDKYYAGDIKEITP